MRLKVTFVSGCYFFEGRGLTFPNFLSVIFRVLYYLGFSTLGEKGEKKRSAFIYSCALRVVCATDDDDVGATRVVEKKGPVSTGATPPWK